MNVSIKFDTNLSKSRVIRYYVDRFIKYYDEYLEL